WNDWFAFGAGVHHFVSHPQMRVEIAFALLFADGKEADCRVRLFDPELDCRLKDLTMHIFPVNHSEPHATQDREDLVLDPLVSVVVAEANKNPHTSSKVISGNSFDHRTLPCSNLNT